MIGVSHICSEFNCTSCPKVRLEQMLIILFGINDAPLLRGWPLLHRLCQQFRSLTVVKCTVMSGFVMCICSGLGRASSL